MTISRKDAQRISAEASKAGAIILGGLLDKEGEHFVVNKTDLTEILETLKGQSVLLVVSPVADDQTENEVKVCLTCGREYVGEECPRCANAWERLRGRRSS